MRNGSGCSRLPGENRVFISKPSFRCCLVTAKQAASPRGGREGTGRGICLARKPAVGAKRQKKRLLRCWEGQRGHGRAWGRRSCAAHVLRLRALAFRVMSPGSRRGGRAFRVGFALQVKQRGVKKDLCPAAGAEIRNGPAHLEHVAGPGSIVVFRGQCLAAARAVALLTLLPAWGTEATWCLGCRQFWELIFARG